MDKQTKKQVRDNVFLYVTPTSVTLENERRIANYRYPKAALMMQSESHNYYVLWRYDCKRTQERRETIGIVALNHCIECHVPTHTLRFIGEARKPKQKPENKGQLKLW